ncbi:uncharacterized protein METZ01_LOCUS49573 [marine metagenome]|uniref:Uncharacterized protein n=1 Tax=marine metagenome TaxID=408172 RepID=A0A381S012_9ZZZZ
MEQDQNHYHPKGGILTVVLLSAICPSPSHGFQEPPWHTQNMLGEIYSKAPRAGLLISDKLK